MCATARSPGAPGRKVSSPGRGPLLSSAVPAPTAPGPWPQKPVPARRRLFCQRRRVSLALRAASPSPPPPQLWLLRRVRRGGASRKHPRQAGGEKKEAGRPTPTQPAALRWAPGRPSAAGAAPGTHWARAPRTPARRLRGEPWAVGALAKTGEWASRVLLCEGQGKGVVARCLAEPSPFPTLSLTRPPVKGSEAQMSRAILNVRSCRPSATVTCASSAPQAPPLVSVTTGSPGGQPSFSIWMMSFSCQKLFNDLLQHLA
ncbi:translation initiation factor IF-2 [Pan troglodytes]|uniref:translation initiation factor IF-2 n=1 Tax=Pan troglodytes TaxID=9598 RepID=UPI00301347F5